MFRHLFTPIIYLMQDCEGGMKFIPLEKNIFPEGNAPGKYDFSKGKNLHVPQTSIILIDMWWFRIHWSGSKRFVLLKSNNLVNVYQFPSTLVFWYKRHLKQFSLEKIIWLHRMLILGIFHVHRMTFFALHVTWLSRTN